MAWPKFGFLAGKPEFSADREPDKIESHQAVPGFIITRDWHNGCQYSENRPFLFVFEGKSDVAADKYHKVIAEILRKIKGRKKIQSSFFRMNGALWQWTFVRLLHLGNPAPAATVAHGHAGCSSAYHHQITQA